jgi:DNA-binding transcriptional ArsR family regulator
VEANQVLDALGDPTRRWLCEELAAGPMAVGELAARLPVSRPAVSQHLKVLKQAGLVFDRAAGNRRLYALDPAGLAEVRHWVDQVWGAALSAFKVAVEQDQNDQPLQEEK